MKERVEYVTKTLLCGLLAVLLSATFAAADGTVIDGDTLNLNGTRYRLNGIDAPESAQSCKTANGKSWKCGEAATNTLVKLTSGKRVSCETLGQDIYGRDIATCQAGGTDLGRAMVAQGMAWAYLKFSDTYAADQAKAQAEKRGIWQGPAQPAWEFREQKWSAASKQAPEGCPIKGNISDNGRIYHTPWSKWYARTKINTTKGERWFCDEAEAVAADWRAAR
jgi:endonuclease YncB( thermonuclease family)